MQSTLNRWVMLGAVGFLGLAAGDAHAWNATGLAVAACQKSLTGGTLELRWDGAYNTSTTSGMWLDCSLPISSNGEYYLAQAQMYYTDGSTTDEVACSFQLRDWDGSLLESGPKRKSGIAAAWPQQYFTWNGFVNHDGIPYASCWIPKSAGGTASGLHGMGMAF